VTEHILRTHNLARSRLAKIRAQAPDDDVQIIMPATIACFRMTRRLISEFSLSKSHVHRWMEDTIGLTGYWCERGPVYAIPLRSLRAVRNRNLLTAGRCISVDTSAWDVTRSIPACVVTGEAAGTAAALAAANDDADVHALPVERLQRQLRAQGALLERNLVKPIQ
jgi:hypothetical protein